MWLHSCYTHTANTNTNTASESSQDILCLQQGLCVFYYFLIKVTQMSVSYLFEQSHGKLLVWYAVFGRADVLSALGTDVEVDTHQEILLRNTWITSINWFPLYCMSLSMHGMLCWSTCLFVLHV